MGLSSYVFPTAEHSRFAHSIGVYATARETFSVLRARAEPLAIAFPGMRFDDDAENAFCVAAMCHDVGHTAFSHALEDVLVPRGFKSHETCTLALLESDKEIAAAVRNMTDMEAVILLIKKEHPNRALSQLISGAFDVDRCDYLIRDSQNAGVYYGQFDFTWLIHALSVDVNQLDQPVLLLDGPRGLDALRQFLSARRYMHRQVYFHPTIRAAQIVLRGIFERISEVEFGGATVSAAPSGLRSLLRHDPISLDDLIQTTDVEVLHLVRSLHETCDEPVLRILCEMFVTRRLPKTVVDSATSHKPLRIADIDESDNAETPFQPTFWRDQDPVRVANLIEQCRALVAERFESIGLPAELSRFLVASELINFKSDPPTDLVFSYGNSNVPLSEIDHVEAGYNVPKLMETFRLYRLFGPAEFRDELRALLSNV
jgi:HD superfamily phosphohydrolase